VNIRVNRSTVEGRAYLDLRALAARTGRATEELHVFYVLEGFLARLALSPYADTFALKGGMLMPVYGSRRPTRDIDLHGLSISNDMDFLRTVVGTIAAIALDDGLVFAPESTTATAIRDGDDDLYAGVRINVPAALATARINFHIDISVGDFVEPHPQPVTLPRLLADSPPLTVLGYPLVMVYAEKIVTAVERRRINTRWRDFADLYLLTRHQDVVGTDLVAALVGVAKHRRVELVPLGTVLAGWPPRAQPAWARWRTKQKLDHQLPADFSAVLDAVISFADPAISMETNERYWSAATGQWSVQARSE
jgi:hypothetical protein